MEEWLEDFLHSATVTLITTRFIILTARILWIHQRDFTLLNHQAKELSAWIDQV